MAVVAPRSVIAGLTASAMHGAKWVDDDVPIEMVWQNARPPRGSWHRDDLLRRGEFELVAGIARYDRRNERHSTSAGADGST